MLRVSFVLAALLAAEGVVLAHPVNYARRNEPPGIVPRAAPDNNQGVHPTHRSPLEDLYGAVVNTMLEGQDSHAKRGYDVDDVETRGFVDLEGLEMRGFGDEESMKRRELNDELMELMARESNRGELDARDFDDGTVVLVPRRHGRHRNRHKVPSSQPRPDSARTSSSTSSEETAESREPPKPELPESESEEPSDTEATAPTAKTGKLKQFGAWGKKIWKHPKTQEFIRKPENREMAKKVVKAAFKHFTGV